MVLSSFDDPFLGFMTPKGTGSDHYGGDFCVQGFFLGVLGVFPEQQSDRNRKHLPLEAGESFVAPSPSSSSWLGRHV